MYPVHEPRTDYSFKQPKEPLSAPVLLGNGHAISHRHRRVVSPFLLLFVLFSFFSLLGDLGSRQPLRTSSSCALFLFDATRLVSSGPLRASQIFKITKYDGSSELVDRLPRSSPRSLKGAKKFHHLCIESIENGVEKAEAARSSGSALKVNRKGDHL